MPLLPGPAQIASVAGASRMLGPFSFAFNTPGINNGVVFYTPKVGDFLLTFFVVISAGFNGATPKGDIGTFVGGNTGIYASGNGAFSLTSAATDIANNAGVSGVSQQVIAVGLQFSAANPLLLVVSQDGTKGGAAVGGTTGAAALYMEITTPSVS